MDVAGASGGSAIATEKSFYDPRPLAGNRILSEHGLRGSPVDVPAQGWREPPEGISRPAGLGGVPAAEHGTGGEKRRIGGHEAHIIAA